MKHIIFSKQCDHDFDLVPIWYHYYKNIYQADLIILTPVKTSRSEITKVCNFYKDKQIEIIPIEMEFWDAEVVWQKQLEIVNEKIKNLNSEFTAISADTDQFFQPLDDQLSSPDVVFRRCFVYSDNSPTLDNIDKFQARAELTYDLVAGFVNTLDNPRVGLTGHFHGLTTREPKREELHFAFRGSKQFKEKISGIAIEQDDAPVTQHWKQWKKLENDKGESGLDELISSMNLNFSTDATSLSILNDFKSLFLNNEQKKERRHPCPFSAQLLQNRFEFSTPNGLQTRDFYFVISELEYIGQRISSGCYLFPQNIKPQRVLDIGGHVGSFSAYLKSFAPEVNIAIFEPNPDTYNLLLSNFQSDNTVKCINSAVSDKTENCLLYKDPIYTFNDSLINNNPYHNLSTEINSISANELSLFFPGERIDIIKLSTNGSTIKILNSAMEILQRTSSLIINYNSQTEKEEICKLVDNFTIHSETQVQGGGYLTLLNTNLTF